MDPFEFLHGSREGVGPWESREEAVLIAFSIYAGELERSLMDLGSSLAGIGAS